MPRRSRSDITVPHIESADLRDLLLKRGCPDVTLSLYDDVGHGDFVVEWGPRSATGSGSSGALPQFAADLLQAILSSSSSSQATTKWK
jgi:hypothetical protein